MTYLQLECSDSSVMFHLSGKELGKDDIAVKLGSRGLGALHQVLSLNSPNTLYPGASVFWASWVGAS